MSQVGCTVYIDGQRVADGSDQAETDDELTVLDGLSHTWGRSTTVDQPEASSLSLTLVNPTPNTSSLVRYGANIKVTATGVTPGKPGLTVFENGGFASGTGPVVLMSGEAADVVADPQLDDFGLQLLGIPVGKPLRTAARAVIAPRAFTPVGQRPDAWDDLPKAQAGQTWHVDGYARGPVGMRLVLGVAGFTSPWDHQPTFADVVEIAADGAWQRLAADFVIPQPAAGGLGLITGKWVGITCELIGPLTRTFDLDPDTTTFGLPDDLVTLDWGRALFDDLAVLAPTGSTMREVTVAEGHLSDIDWSQRSWSVDTDGDGLADEWVTAALLDVTVTDFATELAGRRIGDEPWSAETLGQRVARISELSGGIPVDVAPALAATTVSWQDVDSQPPIDLLRDLAQSADGVLWIQTHPAAGGPYLRLEDPSERASGRVLEWQHTDGYRGYRWTGGRGASPSIEVDEAGTVTRTNLAFNPGQIAGGSNYEQFTNRRWTMQPVAGAADGPTRQLTTYTRATAPVDADGVTAQTGNGVNFGGSYGSSPQATGGWVAYPVTAGATYTVSVYMRYILKATPVVNLAVGVNFHNGTAYAGNAIIGARVQAASGAWQRVSFTVTAPAGYGYLVARADPGSVIVTPDDVFDFTGILIEQAADASEWFSGDTAPNGSITQVGISTVEASGALELSACDLADDAHWVQSGNDVVTRVSVTWLEEIHETDEETGATTTSTTEHTVTLIDDELEAQRGINGMSVSTLLVSEGDAVGLATKLLARLRVTNWRLEDVHTSEALIDDETTVPEKLLALLDSAARPGLALALTGLPDWGPVHPGVTMFLEGASCEFTGGQWVIKPTLSNAVGLGRSARTFDLEPDWRTFDFDPDIATADLNGVTVAGSQSGTLVYAPGGSDGS